MLTYNVWCFDAGATDAQTVQDAESQVRRQRVNVGRLRDVGSEARPRACFGHCPDDMSPCMIKESNLKIACLNMLTRNHITDADTDVPNRSPAAPLLRRSRTSSHESFIINTTKIEQHQKRQITQGSMERMMAE